MSITVMIRNCKQNTENTSGCQTVVRYLSFWYIIVFDVFTGISFYNMSLPYRFVYAKSRMLPHRSNNCWGHYSDVIMSPMASLITSVSIVCSIMCSGENKKETENLDVTGICKGKPPVDSLHKGLVMRKIFPLDDIIMHSPNIEIQKRMDVSVERAMCTQRDGVSLPAITTIIVTSR